MNAAQAAEGGFPNPAWRLAHAADGVEIYEYAPPDRGWFHERLEVYERQVYAQLMTGVCGADGRLRPRTAAVLRDAGGVYRQAVRAPVGSLR